MAQSDGVVRQKQNTESVSAKKKIKTEASRPNISADTSKGSKPQDNNRLSLVKNLDVTGKMVEEHVKEVIVENLSEALKVDIKEIDANEPFADYGLDSITGVHLAQAISQGLKIELETMVFFNYSSVNQLAAFILSAYKDTIIASLRQNLKPVGLDEVLKDNDKEETGEDKGRLQAQQYVKRPLKGRKIEEPDSYKKEENFDIPSQKEPIAIIGMSGRFAKSENLNELWKHLSRGDDLIEEISRWDLSQHYPKEAENWCRYGSFLEDIGRFDSFFFNISGLEATYMDPQQRIFLEESWRALEDSGYAGPAVQGRLCGVYVGCCGGGDYYQLIGDNPPAQAMWGNAGSVIPARIAYYLDLQGPAIAVDTACSSSLVAIHLACQGLWSRETEMALAGGVFIQCTPEFYLSANRAGMLSATGHCHTFDQNADGFVPGEGVGVVVLKRLHKAVADGDHIYGVIKGSGINQDGTTNGITAPSSISQERLERHVYDSFNINPEQVQMVEAHGTGTKLGDPIEYNALTKTFRGYTDKRKYCAIGSIKTNIGHTAAAAGVAGLIKILLSLKHKQIPPSLHFKSGNTNIRFDESPFYVNTTLKDWKTEPNVSRCAVISSFGFSGTNAHMAVEEAPEINRQSLENPGYLIVLSARTPEQLRQQAVRMAEYCEGEAGENCGNISYTLLMGRKHFNHRLACIVRNQGELAAILKKWLEKGKAPQIYISELRESDQREQTSLKRYGNECILNCHNADNGAVYLEYLSAVAELYVQGYSLEFGQLFLEGQYCRIPLPTYPFAGERYLVDENGRKTHTCKENASTQGAVINPLLHKNTSNFYKQRFSSTFTGQEFFLTDHIVKKQRILPGVAYLEMARGAVASASGAMDGCTGIRLRNMVWIRPVIVEDKPVSMHIELSLEDNGEIYYEIYSGHEGGNEERIVHNQGAAAVDECSEALSVDIGALLDELVCGSVSPGQLYQEFRDMGVDYGPAYRGIVKVYMGTGRVLAKLSLPSNISGTANQFVLHPVLMDSALQASAILMGVSYDRMPSKSEGGLKPALLFEMQELEVYRGCTSEMWALIQYSDGAVTSDKIRKLDIYLCSDEGNVCVRMKGISIRAVEGEIGEKKLSLVGEPLVGTLMLSPLWDSVPAVKGQAFIASSEKTVIVGGDKKVRTAMLRDYVKAQVLDIAPGDTIDAIAHKLEKCGPIDHILWIASNDPAQSVVSDALVEERGYGILAAFRMIKALLRLGYGERDFGLSIITVQGQMIHKNHRVNPAHASIHGFTGSLAKEYPNWKLRLIDMEAGCDWFLEDIFALPPDPQGNAWAYRGGEWYRQKLVPVHMQRSCSSRTLYKHGGVYIVIGGAGGIGEVWSEYMIRTYKAQVIWIGRREKDAAIRSKVERLGTLGPAPYYIRTDARDQGALRKAAEEVKKIFTRIDGVIHSAVGTQDQSLMNMSEEHFRAGLSAKADVSVRIAQVFQKETLDFVMFFSSIGAFGKILGHSSYASGCNFEDAFACQLAREWQCRVKVMNWGYWGDIGIANAVPDTLKKRLALTGIGFIEPPEAMEALEALLGGPVDQVVLIKTEAPLNMEGSVPDELITVYNEDISPAVRSIRNYDESAPEASCCMPVSLADKVRAVLTQTASGLLNVGIKDINAGDDLGEYGFDPVMLANFTDILNREYDLGLTPSVLLQYPTLNSLSEYLVEEYGDIFKDRSRTIISKIVFAGYSGNTGAGTPDKLLKTESHMQRVEMEELLCRLLWGQLKAVGLFAGKQTCISDIKGETGLCDLYGRWLEESIAVLVRNNYVKREGESCIVLDDSPIDMESLWREWDLKKDIWLENPDMKARVILVEAVMRALPEIITGKRPATDIMFPNSSVELVEGIYKNNRAADYFNEVLADMTAAYIEERLKLDSSASIRILEIGAGTGGTSSMVFKKLRPYGGNIKEYCYTDISRAFLMHAEKEYGPENPYLTYTIFNVEESAVGQGIEAGGYDIVIAANVLHATKNIRQTLRNAKAVLKNRGLILLNEMIGNTLFAHLTFGLLEGWWRFEDPILRISGCPGLYPETWKSVLENEGFCPVLFPVWEACGLGQQIIMAQSDGVVRQKREQRLAEPSVREYGSTLARKEGISRTKPLVRQSEKQEEEITQDLIREKGTAYIKKLVGEILKIPEHMIDSSAPMEEYGIDSILIVQLTNALRKVFSDVSSTLFFEYQTIDAIVEHFIKTQRDSLIKLTGLKVRERDEDAVIEEATVEIPQARAGAGPGESRFSRRPGRQKISREETQPNREPIAIIGMVGRYPQAENIEEYWSNLEKGKDCIEEITEERWPVKGFFCPDRQEAVAQSKSYSKWGGFLKGFADFDPLFFNISPREANNMDPQERLFIESCWQVLEDAGYTREQIAADYNRQVGVFAGITRIGFNLYGPELQMQGESFFPVTSFGSVANRVSYLLNLQGPSIPVDTMCSSSLTAIHEACEHLHRRECEMAIAGGVNLYLHPSSYIGLCSLQMLSPDGKCKSFGQGGNGFVPGEGVGVILLKPLSKAVRDRDNIYAVIRSTSINHGGKTNGYYVPNPTAQGELVRAALDKAGVNARTVSYIEAHGTGTELGDPIEIKGLTQAFSKDTQDTRFCSIGSVKSNIGHLEAAAGIAGVTKTVLQLRHKKLVPSLYSEKLNPNIDFDSTPFVVQQELAEWKRPVVEVNGRAEEYPRTAGVSSFGAGGANVHIILEEYMCPEDLGEAKVTAAAPQSPAIIVLSARSEDRLREQARRLVAAVELLKFSDSDLADIAYTLQVGRETMEERLAVIVHSIKELKEKVGAFAEGKEGIEELYRGQAKRNKDSLDIFAVDEELQDAVDKWIERKKYIKIMGLWVKGLTFDWSMLYGEVKPRRISLPPYPFARECYWMPKRVKATQGRTGAYNIISSANPLLQLNTSDLSGQRFSSVFTGQEFYLADHVIRGRRVLPGAACLEMARAAFDAASGALKEGCPGIRLNNVVWAQPITVGEQPVRVHIGLFPEENGSVSYEIYSDAPEADAGPVVYSQGSALPITVPEAQTLDIKALQAECVDVLEPSRIYEAYKALGVSYGPGHRGIEKMYVGDGLVMAKLSLPSSIIDTMDQFVLHPGLMDSALQAPIGLFMGSGSRETEDSIKASLPFALQELEIFDGFSPEMWALVRYSGSNKGNKEYINNRVRKFDVDICDEAGKICAVVKGFSTRVLEDDGDLGGQSGPGSAAAAGSPEREAHRPAAGEDRADPAAAKDLSRERAVNYFKSLLSSAIGLPADSIEADSPMEKYGIDSIMVMRLTNELEKVFGSLPKTLFFEYQNIHELTGYFLEAYEGRLTELLGVRNDKQVMPAADNNLKGHPASAEAILPDRPAGSRRLRFAPVNAPSKGKGCKGAVDIAIIGLSGRYPEAENIWKFWTNLRNGKNCIGEIPGERWNHSLYFDEDRSKPGKVHSKWGGFIKDVDRFDPLFFNISPREAELMDPQERLFLECVFETLEDAGYTREALGRYNNLGVEGNVGVYVGVMYEEYQLYGAQEQILGRPLALSGSPSSIANRVSYFCNFHGPSMAVDTMCSSSLTAIHLACQSLQQGGCELAIAGGVNISIHPNKYLLLAQGKFASSKGLCESFGQGGDGYVPGEGVGAVLLKPLSEAIADGDHIYGIIKGTAVNHGGKTNGYTVPNPNAQAGVIGQAFKQAGIDPRTISYLEAHGTGTSLGDPIEITGLAKAFGEYTKDKQFCSIGSVKSNIGHCESAAGTAALTKVLLQMKYGQLVPSLHSRVLNPNIDFSDTPFIVQQELEEWKRPVLYIKGEAKEYPRIAGISSFGAGGANAHIVIEEYIPENMENARITVTTDTPAIIVLSAKNAERLKEQARRLLEAISEQNFTDADLSNMAYTLQIGREAMEERLGLITGSMRELSEKLLGFLEGRDEIPGLYRGRVRRDKEADNALRALAALTADEDITGAVDTWMDKGKYSILPDLWVRGINLDWSRLYRGMKPFRLSLPTYPFARERCWAPSADTNACAANVPVVSGEDGHREEIGSLMVEPCWKRWEAVCISDTEVGPLYIQHIVILCEMDETLRESVENGLNGTAHTRRCIILQSSYQGLEERFREYAAMVFGEIQAVLRDKPKGRVLVQIVVQNQGEQRLFSGLSGLLKTACAENPNIVGQLIEIEPGEEPEDLIVKLKESGQIPAYNRISHVDGKMWTLAWKGVETSGEEAGIPWRDRGVYLITGGAGGLGFVFAREIVKQARDTVLILTGRSRLNEDKQAQLEKLKVSGARVEYRQVDVTLRTAVEGLISGILEEFGTLNGIIHSAGLIRDNFIIKKTGDEFLQVLAPKVAGLVNLDDASKDIRLDFFVFFSSMAGALGNAGQADYSTGNAFMDAYASYRSGLTEAGQRHGRTLSVNWPLWKEGGMQVDEHTRKLMWQNAGMVAMSTSTGIRAFYRGIVSKNPQIMVMEGRLERIRQKLMLVEEAGAVQPEKPCEASASCTYALPMDTGSLVDKVKAALIEFVAKILKVKIEDIDGGSELNEYGFDSVTLTEFTGVINQEYGLELTPPIFFEHSTLQSLAKYLVEEHNTAFASQFAVKTPAEASDNRAKEIPSSQSEMSVPAKAQREYKPEPYPGRQEPVAIVGISGIFPMAGDVDEFWRNLVEGRDCIGEIPEDRWDWKEYYGDPKKEDNKTNIKYGGFIDGVDRFDPLFFGISPREAELMDPQQRLLMIYVWKAIEDAGYSAQSISGTKTALFAGTGSTGYIDLINLANIPFEGFTATGTVPSVGPNRMSYFLNIHGPSEPIETACSSSLIAVHRAVKALEDGSCDMAVAGGVNTIIVPGGHISLSKAGMLCEDGRCKTFSDKANGYVRSEGVGMIVLKKLKDAEKAGDHIYGVILGTAENHGGRANTLTSPNPKAQAELLKAAYTRAEIDLGTITYIEAHGTGTELGDPIEINGLKAAFKELYQLAGGQRVMSPHCGLGSVKSNIGHLELAAGIAGLIKVLLMFKHRTLVKTLHCDTVNPYIQLKDSPFYIVSENKEWKALKDNGGNDIPRRAGVSSFGFGGSNAHVVIEEYIPENQEIKSTVDNAPNPAIIVLSARNEERLEMHVRQLLNAIEEKKFSDNELADMAYTLQVGREPMEERLVVIADSIKDIERKLKAFLEGRNGIEDLYRGQVKRNKDAYAALNTDEDFCGTIDKWIQRKKYAKLVELWVRGMNFDWNKLYEGRKFKPNKMSLPTYPFAQERYWVPVNRAKCGKGVAAPVYKAELASDERPENRKMCILKKSWAACQDISLDESLANSTLNRAVAILAAEDTMELALLLSKSFAVSRIIDVRDIEEQHPENEWKKYDGCVDLVGCGNHKENLMYWAKWLQQLIENGRREGMTLLCVTRGLESYRNTAVNLSGAARAALYRMLQSEYGHIRSRHMDADRLEGDEALVRQIAYEFVMDSDEPEVCYREGRRWRVCLEEVVEVGSSTGAPMFPKDHVLWVTGGTRGIGYLCARHFVQRHGVRHLVLSGREVLPYREHWDYYENQNTPASKKIKAIKELEALGARVEVLSVPLSDKDKVRQEIERVKRTMGPIGGVIHSAGINDGENPAFIRKSMDGMARVFEPKIPGLEVMYESLKNEPLQFFIMFSSVSAVIPALASGQSDYAMANAYMDYFAEAKKHECPIISIQWPSWKMTGMGEVKSKAYLQTGLLSHTDEEGLSLLDHILGVKIGPVVMPAVVNRDLWNPGQLMRHTAQNISPRVGQREILARGSKPQVANGLLNTVQAWLVELLSNELKIKPKNLLIDTPLQDYGVDSVMLVQLLRTINEVVADQLDPSILYEYSTIESFAARLVETHGTYLSKTLGSPAPKEPAVPDEDLADSVSRVYYEKPDTVRMPPQKPCMGESPNRQDIAVIGLSCRFPGADTFEKYWDLLSEGHSAIGPVPGERWGYSGDLYAGLLDRVECRNPKFFLIHEDDAKAMDPQALLLLEECLKLWHHAGYSHLEIKKKSIGVYIGGRSQHIPDEASLSKARNPIVVLGQNYLAANISQFFDIRGPSLVLDTACSSALVGMNMAIQALKSGDIEAAVVGGVSLLSTDGALRMFEQRGILNHGPSFHIFDPRASGIIAGEGSGMVLLKTLNQALEDGDRIYAVIKALSVNNDGRTAGPATPNIQAQKDVMQDALDKSGRKPEEISYIEVNGSGSEVTDLLELKAIQSVYRSDNQTPCGLGSMKPNIGHPLCAEGIAGFIKVVAMLNYGQLVPFLSGEHPMKHFNMEDSPFYFNRKPTPWTNTPRVAAINCFADGGTNVHAVLEAWDGSAAQRIKRQPLPVPEFYQTDIHLSNKQPEMPKNKVNIWKQRKMEEL